MSKHVGEVSHFVRFSFDEEITADYVLKKLKRLGVDVDSNAGTLWAAGKKGHTIFIDDILDAGVIDFDDLKCLKEYLDFIE